MLPRKIKATLWFGALMIAGLAASVQANEAPGVKFNNLTLSPYVNLEVTYDSNVDYDRHEYRDWYFTINPGVDFDYAGNDWGIKGDAWFSYDKYHKYTELNDPRYGFMLSEYWESPQNLRIVFGQRFLQSRVNDSIHDGGRGIWRERRWWDINGAISYQFSEKSGATLFGQWSDMDYRNNSAKYGPLYGWEKWEAGLELSHSLTAKSNILLTGNFSRYSSDGAINNSRNSTGYSLMAGFGSRATERITYRIMNGISWFDYAGGKRRANNLQTEDDDVIINWVYSADVNWLISQKWAASLAGSSYYQPSETQANQASYIQTLSAGLTYRPMRRVTLRGDVGLRRERDEFSRRYADSAYTDYYRKRMTDYYMSARLRADYRFAKYASVYAGVEFMDRESNESFYDYTRFRGTLGLQLRY